MNPERPVQIVVVFGPLSPDAEILASRAAVGAVQARALIRLRRLDVPGAGPPEEVERIRTRYVVPTTADFDWADAIVLATTGRAEVDWKAVIHDAARCSVLLGAVIGLSEDTSAVPAVLVRHGITALGAGPGDGTAAETRALLVGRRIALVARALRSAPSTPADALGLLPSEHMSS